MRIGITGVRVAALPLVLLVGLSGCSPAQRAGDGGVQQQIVGVAPVTRKPILRQLTLSSELVPFEEIDVFAKESGYIKQLLVDYGTRVKAGQLMAVLEIPELEAQIQQDAAAVQSASEELTLARNEINRIEALRNVARLTYERLKGVYDRQPGLVAQQELDDAQGKYIALDAQVEAAKATLRVAQGQLDAAKAKQQHTEVLLDYSKITAPFDGVVTQRYANYGSLLPSGTSNAANVLPLVRLALDDLFRLVIPVPESYVKYIRIGDSVKVRVPSLDKVFPGKVARFSTGVTMETRTMHTEVDVPNPNHALNFGLYAEATLDLGRRSSALAVPLQAVNQSGNQATVFLIGPNDQLVWRNIQLGLQTPSEAEVLEGLSEGDRVVVSDPSGLRAGAIVKPQVVKQLQLPKDNR